MQSRPRHARPALHATKLPPEYEMMSPPRWRLYYFSLEDVAAPLHHAQGCRGLRALITSLGIPLYTTSHVHKARHTDVTNLGLYYVV